MNFNIKSGIDILLATYNGEKYIEEQIKSIERQTYTNWKLFIRDDGSTDNTKEIIKKYVEKYPGKIFNIEDKNKSLGAKGNFFELMKYSKQEYCMFSDQDDVWLPNKIELTISAMKKAEDEKGNNLPILVHTDLKVVNDKLSVIDESFIKYQGLDINMKSLNYLLVQNNITGCTMMINRKLKELCEFNSVNIIMHDWWIGLIASALGSIEFVKEPTILYRQHSSNEVGAKKYNSWIFIKNKLKVVNKSINSGIEQGKVFFEIYENQLNQKDKKILIEFINLKSKNLINRKKSIFYNKFYQSGLIRNIGYLIFI